MNKKNMMIIAGLMLVVTTAMPTIMYRKDAIDYLCDLKTLNKNITEDSFVQDGYEDLIECLQTDIAVIESKLQEVSVKKSLVKSAVAIGGIGIMRDTIPMGAKFLRQMCYGSSRYEAPEGILLLEDYVGGVFNAYLCTAAATYVALNLYETFKTKNELQKSLALDKEFLAQLIGFKEFAEKPLI